MRKMILALSILSSIIQACSLPLAILEAPPGVVLLQVHARHETPANLSALAIRSAVTSDAWLAATGAGDKNADMCGSRLMTPHLQFQLEVLRSLDLLTLKSQQCRIPKAQSLLVMQSRTHALPSSQAATWGEVGQRKYARVVTFLWSVSTFVILVGLVAKTFLWRKPKAKQLQNSGSSVVRGLALFWVEPLMALFRSKCSSEIDRDVINEIQPNLHNEPQAALRAAWHDEIAVRGLEGARLHAAIFSFLGTSGVVQMLFWVGASMFCELAGMTFVLDVLVNFMRWADDARHLRHSLFHIGTFGPVVMIVLLVFCFPLFSRYFTISANMLDSHNTSRISAGLLSLIYEKCQRLPATGSSGSRLVADANQLLTHDATKVWACALKSYAQLVVAPLWMMMFYGILVMRLGSAALAGGIALAFGFIFYLPARELARRHHMRWARLVDSRVRLLKEIVFGNSALRAPGTTENLSERILRVRDQELQTKLEFSMIMGLFSVPVTLFPFALILATLFFQLVSQKSRGVIEAKDIFVCMQVLFGMIACSTVFTGALQRVITLPNSVRRIEQFLRAPELPRRVQQQLHRHPDAPAAQLRGSFAYAADQPAVLHDVNLTIKKGELVAVVGGTASGKSALLSAMLGEMSSADARVETPDCVAYCAQTPWMVEGMLHDNVALKDAKIDRATYEAALASASLGSMSESSVMRVEQEVEAKPMESNMTSFKFPYFGLWNVLTCLAMVLGILNVDWDRTPTLIGLIVVGLQGMLHWSVMEIPLQTIAAFFVKNPPKLRRADGSHLTLVLNYHLLASSKSDVDACMDKMIEAFMGNISKNISAVLVSATNEQALKDYELEVRDRCRDRIVAELSVEGRAWAFADGGKVDAGRRRRVWQPNFGHLDRQDFVDNYLHDFCKKIASEFMVLHRTHRTLRKCGQYQDLMLLSAGYETAFTYCDPELYGKMARNYGEPLFAPSEDVDNVKGRRFDYTLVLDADTGVVPESAFELLEVGAGNPNCAIVQPAIQMDCRPGDTIFIHIEAMRQNINAPLTNTLMSILGESGFYGKGLIKNSLYIERCLGTPEHLLEVVPIDVLSHDTFEAMVLMPLYCGDIQLMEAPCGNYVTWDIRERRWNRGEILLAGYFFPTLVGKPVRFLQKMLQKDKYGGELKVRTSVVPRAISVYLAHSALRQIVFKPFLVMYICLMDFVTMHNPWTPIVVVMFFIILFPKLVTCTRQNFRACILETIASVLQFTPESVVGSIRIMRALKAHLTGYCQWVPQAAVEEEFEKGSTFVSSLNHLWYFPCFAVVAAFVVMNYMPEAIFVMWLLGTLLTLPFYAGLTGLKTSKKILMPDKDLEEKTPFPLMKLRVFVAGLLLIFGIYNIDWALTSPFSGVVMVILQCLLHWLLLEVPLQAISALFTSSPPVPKRADASHSTVSLAFNLEANGTGDVDDCMKNMYAAFMGNIALNVSAILVSVTASDGLRKYELKVRDAFRDRIYRELRHEGLIWAGFSHGFVDSGRGKRLWSTFSHLTPKEFVNEHLDQICYNIAGEFMVAHRDASVAGKAEPHQDLMLLSEGFLMARPLGEPLFFQSDDVIKIRGRHFDYTLVLEANNSVGSDSVSDLLSIGAGNPQRAIIQPAIQMKVELGDSIFGHVAAMRHMLSERLKNTSATIGQSGFSGKGMIKNSLYIASLDTETSLGPRGESDEESSPLVTVPLFASDVVMYEAPVSNYVTWSLLQRQRLQNVWHPCSKRCDRQIDNFATHAIAQNVFQQEFAKPVLLAYIIMLDVVQMHFHRGAFVALMVVSIVLPKVITCSWVDLRATLLELVISFLEFTPECVVGTIRILVALGANVTGHAGGATLRVLEEDFARSNPFTFSARHLWHYPVLATLPFLMYGHMIPDGGYVMWMLASLLALPLFAGLSGMRTDKNDDLLIPLSSALDQWKAKKSTDVELLEMRNTWVEQVEIGPRGAYLTAGERAQVSFARAAYNTHADFVLMDDPFAAVDCATGAHLMRELAVGALFKGRTRVVALPPDSEHLHLFDRVVVLEGGRVIQDGPPADVETKHIRVYSQPTPPPAIRSLAKDVSEPLELKGAENHLRNALDAVVSGGKWRFIAAVSVVLLLRVVATSQLLIMGIWSDRKDIRLGTNDSHYLQVLCSLLFVVGLLQVLQNYLASSFSNNISGSLFNHLLASVLNTPMESMWAKVPAGRILNRLVGDMTTIDTSVSCGFFAGGSFLFNMAAQQIFCLAVIPCWIAIPMYGFIIGFAYLSVSASAQLQYAALASLSKCQEEQAQVEQAPDSVRAWQLQHSLAAKYSANASVVMKLFFFGVSCIKQWLMFRLAFCVCLQCTVCMLYGVLRPGGATGGTLGIIALLTFNIIQELETVVDALIGGIGVGLSLERLTQMLRCGPDIVLSSIDRTRRASEAQAKVVEVLGTSSGLKVRDLMLLPTSGRALNFDVPAGSWFGVVGGVGSGKTVLLCRLAQILPARCDISLGNVDLRNAATELDRDLARRLVRYLPQEPALLEGSIRMNLDPSGQQPEAKLWKALAACQLEPVVRALPDCLDEVLSRTNGTNLSFGQRQLLCLARCVVEQPGLLLLDCSLSAVDSGTRQSVFEAVSSALPRTAFVLSAHRPETVAHCPQVVYLDGCGGFVQPDAV